MDSQNIICGAAAAVVFESASADILAILILEIQFGLCAVYLNGIDILLI